MSQDFQAAFKLSADDRHISIADEGGVALAAIQGLHQQMEDKHNELWRLVQEQQEQIKALKAELGALKGSRQ